ncbi:ABC transporter permease [candidate division WOR-3 bacterium]|nr:ABC transporter permease [candidate division WOR-3 bacterium]
MNYMLEALVNAVKMIVGFNPELLSIVSVSLKVSFISTTLAAIVGVPLGFSIAIRDFWGKRGVIILLNTLLALPTVVVGLFVYSLISRSGPIGRIGLLYTPAAMVAGQFILALPIVTALTVSAIQGMDKRIRKTALTLGANNLQTVSILISERKFAIFSAIIAGFGRVFAEVGVSMMLGGNIKGYTRNITTAIAFETGKGEFSLGLALGIILLSIALSINILVSYFQKKTV